MVRRELRTWHEDASTLYQHYHQAKDTQTRQRLHALWLLRQGRSLRDVATILGVHYRTLQTWLQWYRHSGLDGVVRHRHGGHRLHPRRLTAAQETELMANATAGEIRSIHDGVTWAQAAHQVTYSYWGMRWVFARLGLTPKVPRPTSPKTSPAVQEAWKKGG